MSEPVTDDQRRPEPPAIAGEWDTLLGFLDFQRATFAWRTQGLSDEQLRTRLPQHPTDMTLAGMLKHLAFVEDYWFSLNVGRVAPVEPFASADWQADPDWDWHSAAGDDGDELRALWRGCADRSRELVDGIRREEGDEGLDRVVTRWASEETYSLRWVLTHMIEEYARHNGHADLLRELVDGQVGE